MRIGSVLFNEFSTQRLCTLAFPSLFPYGQGDPTNNETICDISSKETERFAQKLHHLIKYGEFINGKWVYRIVSHPKFGYWAYNIFYRKRLLGQGNC